MRVHGARVRRFPRARKSDRPRREPRGNARDAPLHIMYALLY